MGRKFNTTGVCVPDEHYMVDLSNKITQTKELIDERLYFTINGARQIGKTTLIHALETILSDEYVVISLTFEGLGAEHFETPKTFCQKFIEHVSDALEFTRESKAYCEQWKSTEVVDFDTLSRHITRLTKDKKLVLIIDEVDKVTNNQVFLDFLSMLRKKYIARSKRRDFTFHSVILAGVYDVRNLKWKIKLVNDHQVGRIDQIQNSPWNIATNFDVDMLFNPAEISTMLVEYEHDYPTGMNIEEISKYIYFYTSGYPFLVSRICQIIHKNLNKNWTIDGILKAIKMIQEEESPLFDDLYKNLNNNPTLSQLIKRMLIDGEKFAYKPGILQIGLGIRYGYFSKDEAHGLVISNKIFENILIEHFIALGKMNPEILLVESVHNEFIQDGKFNMQACLEKFAAHYPNIYSAKQAEFLEKEGLLIFLMLLIPALNGKGFYYIEPETRNEERMDLVIAFGGEEFIVELKKWRGAKKHELAYEQLNGYLDARNAHEGYLLTFDFRQKKQPKAEWIQYEDKKIFDVIV